MPEDASERTCGGCSLCCTVLRVDPLRKLGGIPCARLGEAGGCSIHPVRPAICRAYRCLWLQGSFDEQDRPDRIGAVLDLVSEGGEPRLTVREAEPGAVERSPRLQAIIERHRAFQPVRISYTDGSIDPDRAFRVLMPGGEERRVEGDAVVVFGEGRELRREHRPALDRWLRRATGWLRARRLRHYDDGSSATDSLVSTTQAAPGPRPEGPA